MEKIRVALIGAGYMAREHARAFSDLPEVSLVGIVSRTRKKAEEVAARFAIGGTFDSVDELYRGTQPHLVILTVPELALREVCAAVFRHPWVCLLEKPAGYDLADAELISRMATEAGRTVYVALNRRHYASTRAALADLAGVEEPRLIQVLDQEEPAARVQDRPALVVKNWMYANSIHVVDYLRLFGRGRIVNVTPTLRFNPVEPRFVSAKVEFSSGDIGLYTAIWNGPGPWAVTVTTQQRAWELRPLEQAGLQRLGSRKLEVLPPHRWDVDFKPGLRLQAEEAIRAVRGLPHALPTLESGLESVRLIRAIYEV